MSTKKTKPTAYANPIDGFGTLYDVTYAGQSDCDKAVRFSYLRKLAIDGHRVEVAASKADGDYPRVIMPHTGEIVSPRLGHID